MPLTPRTKKYTDYAYLITNPADEDAVRNQMDGAVDEVFTTVDNETAKLSGGNAFVGTQSINGSTIHSNNTGVLGKTTANITTPLVVLSSDDKVYIGDTTLPIVIQGTNLTLPSAILTAISSGFSSGWSGTTNVLQSGKETQLAINLTKTTDVTSSELLYTLPVGVRPSFTMILPIDLFDNGGASINGNESFIVINSNGTITVNQHAGSVTTNARLVFNYVVSYIAA